LRVELVVDDAVRIRAFVGPNIGRERLELAGHPGKRDRAPTIDRLQTLAEMRRAPHHLRRLGVDDAGLAAIVGGEIDLRAGLVVAGEQIQPGPRHQGRLAIFLRAPNPAATMAA
jgi:hypothetical protein